MANLWFSNIAAAQQTGANFPGGGLTTGPAIPLGSGFTGTITTAAGAYNDSTQELGAGCTIVATYTMTANEVALDVVELALLPALMYINPYASYVYTNGVAGTATITIGDLDPTVFNATSITTSNVNAPNGVGFSSTSVFTIATLGTTNWVTYGSSANTVGTQFTWNGTVPAGTGTVTLANNTRYSGSLTVTSSTVLAFVPTGSATTAAGAIAPYEVQSDAFLTATFATLTTPTAAKLLVFWIQAVGSY